MKRRLALLLTVVVLLAACSRQTETLYTTEDVVAALKAAQLDAAVLNAASSEDGIFGVPGRAISVGEHTFEVYEFSSAGAQEQIKISPDGSTIETRKWFSRRVAAVSWIAPPKMVRKRNLIVAVVIPDTNLATRIADAISAMP